MAKILVWQQYTNARIYIDKKRAYRCVCVDYKYVPRISTPHHPHMALCYIDTIYLCIACVYIYFFWVIYIH